MDGFDNWITTTPDDYLKHVADCETCGAELYEGYEALEHQGELFCDKDCLLNSLDYLEITVCK